MAFSVYGMIESLRGLSGREDDAPTPPANDGYVSIETAALHFGISTKTVRRLIARREWRAHRIGKQLRIKLDEIVAPPKVGRLPARAQRPA